MISVDSPSSVHRPFQFLGSKLRSVEAITEMTEGLISRGGRVADLFSGSSVVSQAFAVRGYKVTSFDALAFCTHAAKATLGVDRQPEESLSNIGRCIVEQAIAYDFNTPFLPWLELERKTLARGDGLNLLDLNGSFPQVWRPQGAKKPLLDLFERMLSSAGKPSLVAGPVVATHYAGTYFGLRQALDIDAIRWAIETVEISPWARSAALTALVSASSAAVFSAGKHFAQPHKISPRKNLNFHARRILDDRSVDISTIFIESMDELNKVPFDISSRHGAEHRSMESLLGEQRHGVDLVYADPPYTAQQYSRFYHIPETLISGLVPDLQQHRSNTTSGLYPEDRFKSRFCSKREAPNAFQDLVELTSLWGASIIISYAGSPNGKSGNARMVSIDDITDLLRSRGFRDVQVANLDHNYRQLNRDGLAVDGRNDIEYLICGSH